MTTTDPERIAPYPTERSEATADRLARSYTVAGWQAWTKWTAGRGTAQTEAEKDIRDLTLLVAIDSFAVADLLRAVQKHAPGHADEIARSLYAAIDEGGTVGELLHDFLRSYGIDPAAAEWRESVTA